MSSDRIRLVEQAWPYDGPHTAETVEDAAQAISALVRYLNNATAPGNARRSLEWAATINSIASGVKAALYGLDQLLGQLSIAMHLQATNPTLYEARVDGRPSRTAREVAYRLTEARDALHAPAERLDEATQLGFHLGND